MTTLTVRNSNVPRLLNHCYSSDKEPDLAPSPLYERNSDREGSPDPQQDVQYEQEEEYVVKETVDQLQIKREVDDQAINESTPTRTVILEDTESQDGSPVGIVQSLFHNIVQNVIQEPESHEDAQRTPPRIGRLVYEEKIRSTPVKDRTGPTLDARRTAQNDFPARDRIGTHPPAYGQPGTSRTPDTRKPKKKGRSREARNSADRKGRKSMPRKAKNSVTYREGGEEKLDGQMGGCSFPTSYHETTTDLDTDSEYDADLSNPRE